MHVQFKIKIEKRFAYLSLLSKVRTEYFCRQSKYDHSYKLILYIFNIHRQTYFRKRKKKQVLLLRNTRIPNPIILLPNHTKKRRVINNMT